MVKTEREFFGKKVEPSIRHLYDMKEVVYDKDWLENAENVPLYYMYRDLYKDEDRETILKNNLRYDITIMPPRRLGKEFVKTKGHYHPKINGLTYPEIYEVIEGRADCLLQKKEDGRITKALIVKAKAGDHVIIPPNFGHITINPSNKTLKMANWVNRTFDSIYQPILENKGGCYFELIRGFKKNENYKEVPDLEIYEAPENDLFKGRKMYNLIKKPKIFEFLNKPKEEFFKRLDYYQ